MSTMPRTLSIRYCGRAFTAEDLDRIRDLIASDPRLNRAQLSRLVCDQLGWRRPDGRCKEMSCRVAMLRMHRDGLIDLPPPQKGNGNGHSRPRLTPASDPEDPLSLPPKALAPLRVQTVDQDPDSCLWNELIERYHYLGYAPLPGAQMRYLVFSGPHLLAALGFGAAAWKVAPRDRFIGWSDEERRCHLHLVVNNARFLILPWVRSPNLASCILGRIVKQLPEDWQSRYRYRPVLLETFVQKDRFRGTCYRAANWLPVGQTQGRGKLDRHHRPRLPVKDVYVYPLQKDFRTMLCLTPQPVG